MKSSAFNQIRKEDKQAKNRSGVPSATCVTPLRKLSKEHPRGVSSSRPQKNQWLWRINPEGEVRHVFESVARDQLEI